MIFLFRLAGHLGKTVQELLQTMSSYEFQLWGWYYSTHGFDADRIENTVANAGSATAMAMGNKAATAGKLVAKFGQESKQVNNIRMIAFLNSLTPERFHGRKK